MVDTTTAARKDLVRSGYWATFGLSDGFDEFPGAPETAPSDAPLALAGEIEVGDSILARLQ